MYTIILFYKYVEIADPEKLRLEQLNLATKLELKGRVIVAKEGINATLEGTNENIEKYLKKLSTWTSDVQVHRSVGTGNAFPKLKIKVRPEIVSLHLNDDIDPTKLSGKKLKPEKLKQWFENGKDFHIVDMRNDYEYKIGHFKNSYMPKLENFRDVPRVLDELEPLKNKTVLTVCTGGVRCEKASGLLLKNGFKDVYQLDGGIVTYMEKFPAQEFQGKLYVFDGRITMDFDPRNKHVVVGVCDKCSTSSERYVNCKRLECNKHFICCEQCSDSETVAFCSDECRVKFTR